jgi:hypothetical protein
MSSFDGKSVNSMAWAASLELPIELEGIAGARELYDWFGYWPSFHDAEVLRLELSRTGTSSIAVHTWHTTNEVDGRGYHVMQKHVVVNFLMDDVLGLDLDGFNHQNVIFGLRLAKKNEGFELALDPCYGLAGTIQASKVEIRMNPGKPGHRDDN